ncbi:hypothetical protein HED50_02870 [Ochrobactrum oryzae]|uniref:Uncharacterized protein n=1 Tax=Brucella oryzae TaxID=335286 RepID=A0A2S7IZS1_9HYPH|nr:hypothetical protein [Brucella oryzae]NKC21952.1 hypothetical protein [Brucella oryzae]PQA73499.1 hypothetical protein C3731_11165 [Brucella oryzae]
MQQPDYDRDFGEIIRWLQQEGLILQTDLEGNTELSTRAERTDHKRRKAAEIPSDSPRLS